MTVKEETNEAVVDLEKEKPQEEKSPEEESVQENDPMVVKIEQSADTISSEQKDPELTETSEIEKKEEENISESSAIDKKEVCVIYF